MELDDSINHLQTDSNLLIQKPEPIFSPRSLHSSHQLPLPGRRLLVKAVTHVSLCRIYVPWFPLLLSLLGPLTVKRIEGQPNHLLYSLVYVIADIVSAMLIRVTEQNLRFAYFHSLKALNLVIQLEVSGVVIYLWNPFTIVACVGLSTLPSKNMAVISCLYGACSRLVPLAAFGWVIATHLSLYPVILIIPVILLLGCGPDAPPRKLFMQRHQQEVSVEPVKAPTWLLM